jgi:hypothetical protein
MLYMSDEGATNNFSQCEGHVKIMEFCHRVRAIFLSHVTAWFETSQRPSFHNDWQPQKVYYEVTSRPFESARAAKRLNVELHPSVCANSSTLHSHTEVALSTSKAHSLKCPRCDMFAIVGIVTQKIISRSRGATHYSDSRSRVGYVNLNCQCFSGRIPTSHQRCSLLSVRLIWAVCLDHTGCAH